MNQDQMIIKRDYYYEYDITWNDRIKYAVFILLENILTYFFIILCISRMLAIWQGWAMHTVFEILISIPISFILPIIMMKIYLKKIIPRIYSLLDDTSRWPKKMISLLLFGEIFRFIFGLIPTPITIFGTLSSPVTMMLYTLFYLNPFERFEAVFYGGSISFLDIIIFLLIYLLYYTLHEFIIWRIYRNEYSSHIRFLEGSKKEYEKEQKIYKPI